MRIKLSWFLALVAVLSITACTSTPEERPSQRQNSQISQSLFDYSDSQIEQFLVRGATTQSMITARFGQPRGMSQSGDYILLALYRTLPARRRAQWTCDLECGVRPCTK